jgi:4-amino-4-deoxy-L-arabinose transferase-like glycosyltransferase
MTRRLVLVPLLALPLFLWRIDRPGFSDTEGMFVEPAREMVVTGDWITPRMNGEPFLVKPPLMYWLPAAAFAVAGPTERARVWPAAAALATVFVTGALAAELFGPTAGLMASLVLATSLGFLLEARFVRADMLLVLTVSLALWCYVRLRRGGGRGAAVAFWITVAVGLLDKGLLALLLPGGVIALDEILAGELRPRTVVSRLRALDAPLGLVLVAAVAAPWHTLAALRNPGFAWDYFVNQHLLFFFDQKLPRDSIADSLGFFWAMFGARTLPWSLVLPGALLHAGRTLRDRPALRLPLVWTALVLGFFSLAASRLEHYSLPALPAVAILVGVCLADAAAGRLRVSRAWFVVPPATVALAAGALAMGDPGALVARLDPTLAGYGLAPLTRPTALTVALGFGALATTLATRRGWAPLVTGAVTAAVLFVFVQLAHERVEPLFSWRPFAATIRASVPDGIPLFFRASDEYQLCGGLDYYTGRYVSLLAPPGWVPPTFLAGRTDRLFTAPAQFERAWREDDALLVSDDVPEGDDARITPGPYSLVSRAGERVLLRTARTPSPDVAVR